MYNIFLTHFLFFFFFCLSDLVWVDFFMSAVHIIVWCYYFYYYDEREEFFYAPLPCNNITHYIIRRFWKVILFYLFINWQEINVCLYFTRNKLRVSYKILYYLFDCFQRLIWRWRDNPFGNIILLMYFITVVVDRYFI